jgi:hypothetical protein
MLRPDRDSQHPAAALCACNGHAPAALGLAERPAQAAAAESSLPGGHARARLEQLPDRAARAVRADEQVVGEGLAAPAGRRPAHDAPRVQVYVLRQAAAVGALNYPNNF